MPQQRKRVQHLIEDEFRRWMPPGVELTTYPDHPGGDRSPVLNVTATMRVEDLPLRKRTIEIARVISDFEVRRMVIIPQPTPLMELLSYMIEHDPYRPIWSQRGLVMVESLSIDMVHAMLRLKQDSMAALDHGSSGEIIHA